MDRVTAEAAAEPTPTKPAPEAARDGPARPTNGSAAGRRALTARWLRESAGTWARAATPGRGTSERAGAGDCADSRRAATCSTGRLRRDRTGDATEGPRAPACAMAGAATERALAETGARVELGLAVPGAGAGATARASPKFSTDAAGLVERVPAASVAALRLGAVRADAPRDGAPAAAEDAGVRTAERAAELADRAAAG